MAYNRLSPLCDYSRGLIANTFSWVAAMTVALGPLLLPFFTPKKQRSLDQRLAKLYCKGPDRKYFWLCCTLCLYCSCCTPTVKTVKAAIDNM